MFFLVTQHTAMTVLHAHAYIRMAYQFRQSIHRLLAYYMSAVNVPVQNALIDRHFCHLCIFPSVALLCNSSQHIGKKTRLCNSQILAEPEAQKWAAEVGVPLAFINPSCILGPVLPPKAYGFSMDIMEVTTSAL